MVINNVEGLVIKQMDYKESSKILKLFTKDLGKISVIAQGAYRKSSRCFSSTNLFNIVEYDLNTGKKFYYLKDASLIESNSFLTGSIDLIVTSNLIVEIIDKLIQEGSKEEEVYELTIRHFKSLKDSQDNRDLIALRLLSYLLKFISFLGYRPDFTGCLSCKKTISNKYYPYYNLGGLLCYDCLGKEAIDEINREEFLLLNNLLYLASHVHIDIELNDRIDLKKLLKITLNYLKYSFEIKQINTEAWLERINYI